MYHILSTLSYLTHDEVRSVLLQNIFTINLPLPQETIIVGISFSISSTAKVLSLKSTLPLTLMIIFLK